VFSIIPDFFFPYGTKLLSNITCIPSELKDIRKIIDLNINAAGGGIDPETGYSRRAMNVFHNFDFENKIKISPQSYGKNFIAGKIMSNKQKNIFTNKTSKIWFIIGMFIILIILVVIIILNYKK
jgi:hypothetical protein